jgi:cytochrome P450
MLMSARDKDTGAAMSERQLIDEIMTLVIAGHETTASVLNWTWYLLSQHPQVEARVHQEISGRKPATPGLGHLEALEFTHQVLKETMRLYPPGWLLSREAIGPDRLGGYDIPAGANILVPLYLVHRHPRFWKDPDAFLPERFTPEQDAERPRFAYMPFAAGPRHCIGETLAVYEMLLHLCKIVPSYRLVFVPDKPQQLEAQINLRTRHPLHMQLEPR